MVAGLAPHHLTEESHVATDSDRQGGGTINETQTDGQMDTDADRQADGHTGESQAETQTGKQGNTRQSRMTRM